MHGCSVVEHPIICLKAEHAEASRQTFFLMSSLKYTRASRPCVSILYPTLLSCHSGNHYQHGCRIKSNKSNEDHYRRLRPSNRLTAASLLRNSLVTCVLTFKLLFLFFSFISIQGSSPMKSLQILHIRLCSPRYPSWALVAYAERIKGNYAVPPNFVKSCPTLYIHIGVGYLHGSNFSTIIFLSRGMTQSHAYTGFTV